jgi:hypothetical protein
MSKISEVFRLVLGPREKKAVASCASLQCPTILLSQSLSQSEVGIHVGERWYCSVDCFAQSSRDRFVSLSSGRVVEMPHQPRMSIGLVLLAKQLITDDQLRIALEKSQDAGTDITLILLEMGLVNELQIATARAAQWGHPFFGADRILQPIEGDMPAVLLNTASAAPLHYSSEAKRLVLGFVHRVDFSLLDVLEQMTGVRAEPCFITPTQHRGQMELFSAKPGYEVVEYHDSFTPSQMARAIAGVAVDIRASEARFARHRNVVWTRLSGKRRSVDVLFRGNCTFQENESTVIQPAGRKILQLG